MTAIFISPEPKLNLKSEFFFIKEKWIINKEKGLSLIQKGIVKKKLIF